LPFASPIIIPNGIDTRALAARAAASRDEVRAELGLASDDVAFANVARLHPDKGQATLIAAFARAALPRARLYVVGVGPLDAELRGLAASLGVADRVRFLGERTDVPRLLGGFDAYVHPSLAEALGISVLEAMSAGLPTIGAAADALPEYITDGATGWLFPPGDAAELAERLRAVAGDLTAARAVGAAGQARMFRDYDIGASVTAYEALYERLLS
jgi:glycosyltransferase involved in cell wall biosynthesis